MTGEKQPENTEIKKVDAEVVLDSKMEKAIEKAVLSAVIKLDKKDYRATTLHLEGQAPPPDAYTVFVNIDGEKTNEFGFNRDLDMLGHITPHQAWRNKLTRVAVALAEMKDWRYIERQDPEDETKTVQIPIDLAQLAAEEERWLALGLFGMQSEKHIKLTRASVGIEPDQESKAARWFFGTTRKKKSEVYDQRGMQE